MAKILHSEIKEGRAIKIQDDIIIGGNLAEAYIDNILVMTKTATDHKTHLSEIL